jgi:hypothetical protein
MGGGLLQLVSYGKEDEILMANPEITFFKIVYHKYTNFSLDMVQTIHLIRYDSSIEIPIARTGELLYKLFIKLELPQVSVIYNETIKQKIFEFISDIYYNYTIYTYAINMGIISCLNNLYNNELNKLDNEHNIIEFFTYINKDGSLVKLYNIFESANLMICNQNLNTDIKLSKYYNERNILKNIIEPITESTT